MLAFGAQRGDVESANFPIEQLTQRRMQCAIKGARRQDNARQAQKPSTTHATVARPAW